MHTKLSSWLSLIALLALFTWEVAAQTPSTPTAGAATASATAQMPGEIRIARKVGKVTAKNTVTGNETDLVNGSVITQGNIVRTDVDSSVVLLFSSGASINLAFSSELNIETFTQGSFDSGNYEPAKEEAEPSVSTTNISLTRGELVGNVKKLKRGGAVESKFTVGTPVGAAGIRGTTFKITYRPTGDGRFTFSLTTVEGNVALAVGTVNAPPTAVMTNQEVVLNNVEVNAATNQVTATTSTGQTVVVAAAPPAVAAPASTVALVTTVATQLAQAVINVVFVSPTPPTPTTATTSTPGSAPASEEKKETPVPTAPPTTPTTTPTPSPEEKKVLPSQPPTPTGPPAVVPKSETTLPTSQLPVKEQSQRSGPL